MSNDLDFSDLTLTELSVRVGEQTYTLREASGAAACTYRNAMIRCTTLGSDGKATRMDNIADTEPLLVSLCLFDDKNRPVPVETIRSWPSRIVTKLYNKAREISSLEEGPTERELLLEALKADKSPCTIQKLREHIKQLDVEKFAPLQKWIKPTPEEEAKNSLRQTEVGSV